MRRTIRFLIAVILIAFVLWILSFAVEAVRPSPHEQQTLNWAPNASVQRADLDGVKVRYIKTGAGPDLVLFHTLRTQSDIYQKMLPLLKEHFTVHVVDYPGHGWSDIPAARYHPDDFYLWAEKFLDAIDVRDATVAGISIGGTIVLELAARQNPHIKQVISINPYDYADTFTSGLKGSSFFAQIMFTATDIPFIGETFMRLRNPIVERAIFDGGVADPKAISQPLFKEFAAIGNRPGHYRGFLNLLRERHHWQKARANYPKINLPVLLIYGDKDWASPGDRQKTQQQIPNVQTKSIQDGGHFLSLDKPAELSQAIIDFAKDK